MHRYWSSVAVMAASGCMAVGVFVTGCGGGATHSSTAPTHRPLAPHSPPAVRQSTTTSTGPSAANDLAAYFDAALAVDQRLKSAAAVVDRAIGAEQITISPAIIDTINAADPSEAATKIPAGLTLDVLQRVVLVQGDLLSRFYSFRGFGLSVSQADRTEVVPLSDQRATYMLDCLKNGSSPAGTFSTDLAAARAAAA